MVQIARVVAEQAAKEYGLGAPEAGKCPRAAIKRTPAPFNAARHCSVGAATYDSA